MQISIANSPTLNSQANILFYSILFSNIKVVLYSKQLTHCMLC